MTQRKPRKLFTRDRWEGVLYLGVMALFVGAILGSIYAAEKGRPATPPSHQRERGDLDQDAWDSVVH